MRTIEETAVDKKARPLEEIIITACGQLTDDHVDDDEDDSEARRREKKERKQRKKEKKHKKHMKE